MSYHGDMADASVYLPSTIDRSDIERIVAGVVPEDFNAYSIVDGITYVPGGLSTAVFLSHRPEDEIMKLADQILAAAVAEFNIEGMTSRELDELAD